MIESLSIHRFAGLRDVRISFEKGVNLIEGDNEAGKTSAALFCQYILYGLRGEQLRRCTPHDGSVCAGSMVLSFPDGRWRIDRSGADSPRIVNLESNTVVPCTVSPGEFFFGAPEAVFTGTVCVHQAHGATLSGASLREAAGNLLSAADESLDLSRALSRLDKSRVALLYKNEKGGQIAELRRKQDELSAALTGAQSENEQVLALEKSTAENEARLENATQKYQAAEAALRRAELFGEIQQFRRLHSAQKSLRDALAARDDFKAKNSFNGFFPDENYPARLTETQRILRELEQSKAALERTRDALTGSEPDRSDCLSTLDEIAELGGEDAVLKRVLHLLHARRRGQLFASLLVVLFIAGLCAGIPLIVLSGDMIPAAICLLGGMLALVIAAILFNNARCRGRELDDLYDTVGAYDLPSLRDALQNAREDRSRNDTFQGKLSTLDQQSDVLRQKIDGARQTLSELTAQWGLDADSDEAISAAADRSRAVLAQYRTLCDALNAEAASCNAVREQLSGKNEAELLEEWKTQCTLCRRLGVPDEIGNLELRRKELAFYRASSRALEERRRDLEKQLAAARASTEDPADVAAALNDTALRLRDAEKQHAALRLAYDRLSEAGSKMASSFTPRLSRRAGELMAQASDGKYALLGVNSQLDMEYTADENGLTGSYPVSQLSAGTADIAYTSLRIALAELLFPDRMPPLLFDESFARLDDTRLRAVLRMLRGQEQVLLLTCTHRERQLMDEAGQPYHLISL